MSDKILKQNDKEKHSEKLDNNSKKKSWKYFQFLLRALKHKKEKSVPSSHFANVFSPLLKKENQQK